MDLRGDEPGRRSVVAPANHCARPLAGARPSRAEGVPGAAAQQANRAKSESLTTMSHELRTPIGASLGGQELFAMGRTFSVRLPRA